MKDNEVKVSAEAMIRLTFLIVCRKSISIVTLSESDNEILRKSGRPIMWLEVKMRTYLRSKRMGVSDQFTVRLWPSSIDETDYDTNSTVVPLENP